MCFIIKRDFRGDVDSVVLYGPLERGEEWGWVGCEISEFTDIYKPSWIWVDSKVAFF